MKKTLSLLFLTLPFQAITQSNSLKSPQNLRPAQAAQYTQAALTAPLIFKWTPQTPEQEAPTKYRLKIWQLMVGQSVPQTMKAKKPLVIKDVKLATTTEIFGLISGPCIAHYPCRFVWTVQAMSMYGDYVISPNNGTSKPTSFQVIPTTKSTKNLVTN